MITLLGGIVLAAGIFAAFLWSLYAATQHRGLYRWGAGAACLGTIFGMAAISLTSPGLAIIAGLIVAAGGLVGLISEPGFTKLLPALHIVFGGVLITGLPFV